MSSQAGPLNNLATVVTKIGYESVISYNLGIFNDVGQFACTGPGAGTLSSTSTFNQQAYTLPATGEALVVRCNVPIQSTQDIVVTILGQDTAGACSGTATIKAQSPRGQAFLVTELDGGRLWTSVTSVSITNGVAGDGFDISVVPHYQDDVEVLYVQAVTPNLGTPIKPIYNRYDLKHVKRLRFENKMTIGNFYTNNRVGLSLIDDRYVTLRQDVHDDGGNLITETRYYDRCRTIVTVDQAADGAASIEGKAEGFFVRQFIFS